MEFPVHIVLLYRQTHLSQSSYLPPFSPTILSLPLCIPRIPPTRNVSRQSETQGGADVAMRSKLLRSGGRSPRMKSLAPDRGARRGAVEGMPRGIVATGVLSQYHPRRKDFPPWDPPGFSITGPQRRATSAACQYLANISLHGTTSAQVSSPIENSHQR